MKCMKRYCLMFILLMSLLMLPASVQAAKHFTLDEGLSEAADKIGKATVKEQRPKQL